MRMLITKSIIFVIFVALAYSSDLTDNVDCFRMQDSQYGHYVNCSTSKPLPLKAETTIQLDQDYHWNPYTSYGVYLMDGNQKDIFLSNCFKGVPSEGDKSKGTNLTLSVQCNTLPRQLKQYDMVKYIFLFPEIPKWLIFAIPIPGYSTSEDVKKIMIDGGFKMTKQMQKDILSKVLYQSQHIQHKGPTFMKNLKSLRRQNI